jgi:CheY-like chemotaxis protein
MTAATSSGAPRSRLDAGAPAADILLVEDNDEFRAVYAEYLKGAGHSVRVAANGVEGLHLIDDRLPGVVISDVEMPLLDGPTMLSRMFVENLECARIPFILISASAELPAIAAAIGTPYFLSKPFRGEALLELLARALGETVTRCFVSDSR